MRARDGETSDTESMSKKRGGRERDGESEGGERVFVCVRA